MSDYLHTNATVAEEEEDPSLAIVSVDEREHVMQMLTTEYTEAESERDRRKRRIQKWRKQLEIELSEEIKNTPIENASNVEMPITRMYANRAYGNTYGALSRDPPVQMTSLRDDPTLKKQAEIGQKYLNTLAKSPLDLDYQRRLKEFGREAVEMGTSFIYTPWIEESHNLKWRDEDGVDHQTEQVEHFGPAMYTLPWEDVVYKSIWRDVQKMPCIFLHLQFSEQELYLAQETGYFKNVDKILESPRTTPDESESAQSRLSKLDLSNFKIWDILIGYFWYDSDGDGTQEDIVWFFHKDTNTLLREEYNSLGERPIYPIRYMRNTRSLTGTGVCQLLESIQDEGTAIHNMRNDNMKIANTRMFAVKGNSNIKAKERIYAGKIWEMDNPRDDIQAIPIGEVYGSSMEAEMQDFNLAEQVTAMPAIMGGQADPTLKSRDTFAGQNLRLSQGNKVFESVVDDMQDDVSCALRGIFYQLILHHDDVMQKERQIARLSQEDLAILDSLLSMDIAEVPIKFAFSLSMTDIDKTYEVMRQNYVMASTLYSQFSQQTIPLMEQIFGPQGMQMRQVAPDLWMYMLQIFVGANEFMAQIFKFMNIENSEDFVPNVKKQKMISDMFNSMVQAQANLAQGAGAANAMMQGGNNVSGNAQPQGAVPQLGAGGAAGPAPANAAGGGGGGANAGASPFAVPPVVTPGGTVPVNPAGGP